MVEPNSCVTINVKLKSLSSNVFSHLNVNIPCIIEWVDSKDESNVVKFRETIYLRIVKLAKLNTDNVKKNINPTEIDVYSNLLNNMITDLFDEGFIDECLNRLENHPDPL